MDQVNYVETHSGPSVQPAKRSRGRPRKQLTLNHAEASHPSPGFGRPKEHIPHKAADSSAGVDNMVGQAVTGVVEATFDAGYLLSVRIGNTNLRGVVFKPGHYVPVTAQNDIAPHVQMVQRNPGQNSRGHNLSMQAAGTGPTKRKYGSSNINPSVPPVGVRGTVVPVVLQPVNRSNGLPNQILSNVSQTGDMLDFGDKDVHMVEPISMLQPGRSIPAGQIFVNHSIQQVKHNFNGLFNEGTFQIGQEDKAKTTAPTVVDTQASSESSGCKVENSKETSSDDSGILSKHETGNTSEPFTIDFSQAASVAKPFFSYGSGRMTELLQAVQENMENKVQTAEQLKHVSLFGFHEPSEVETDPKNGSSVS